MRNSINNLLPRTINYNYRQSVCPLQVKVSNTTKTNKTKKIAVFGSALNEFENNDIVPSQMNVSYSLLQKQLLSTSYHIGLMRITTDVKSQKKLKNLVISLESFDSSGQSIQIPILVGTYIKKGQFLSAGSMKFAVDKVREAGNREISNKKSKTKIYIIPTNEELVIATDTYKLTKSL